MDLHATLEEMKEEVQAHMDITEDLTNKARGNNKAYLTAVNDVVTERLKVRREAEEAKQRATEAKQEAETGSVKTAEGELTSQLDNGEHKDAEPKEDTSSQAAVPPAAEESVSDANAGSAALKTESLEPLNKEAQPALSTSPESGSPLRWRSRKGQTRMRKQSRTAKTSAPTSRRHKPKIGLSSRLLSRRRVVAAAARFLDVRASGNQSSPTSSIGPLSRLLPARMGQMSTTRGSRATEGEQRDGSQITKRPETARVISCTLRRRSFASQLPQTGPDGELEQLVQTGSGG